jgi:hypothetical protein
MNQNLSLLDYSSPDPYAANILTLDEDGKLLELQQYYSDDGNEACIFIIKQNPGVYTVRVVESISTGTFVAFGTVEVTDDGQFTVNGVLDGPLHDKYNDCFDIYPRVYKHFFGFANDEYEDNEDNEDKDEYPSFSL